MNKLKSIITPFFSVFVILIISIIFIFKDENYNAKNTINKYNFLAFLVGFLILILILIIVLRVNLNWINRKKKLYIIVSILFLIQLFLVYSYYFRTGWDSYTVSDNAIYYSDNQSVVDVWYYGTYPNNIFITRFIASLITIAKFFKISGSHFFISVFFMVILNTLTGILIYKISSKIYTNNKVSLVVYIYYQLLVGFSPWISIPYTDSLGLIFPTLILFTYLHINDGWVKYGLLGIITVIGINIKPQVIVVSIAIIMYEFLIKNKIKFLYFCIMVFSMVISNFSVKLYTSNIINQINPEKNIGLAHFVKMGLNYSTDGVYSAEDVQESNKIPLKKDRDIYNIRMTLDRLSSPSLVNHFFKKLLVNFSDGSFAWAKEGTFFLKIYEDKTFISPLLKNIFYTNGAYFRYFLFLQQSHWIVVLCLILISILKKDKDDTQYILYILFLGAFLFSMIFEARARYLFINVPLFILIAGYGINEIQNYIEKKLIYKMPNLK